MLSSAQLGHSSQKTPFVLDIVRKFRDFLNDESAAAAIEYIILGAGIAVAIMTAVKPANASLACHTCGRQMRFARTISQFRRHPELRIYKCVKCKETTVEEWRPRENRGKRIPNSRQGARTLAAGLAVLRKEWEIRDFDIAVILGIWAGSIAFGWTQQPHWLAVPPVVCIAHTVFLTGHYSTRAARVLVLGRRKILESWMSGRAAGLALFNLVASWRWVGLGGRFQKKQDDVPHHDLALGVRRRPCCFLRTRKLVLSSHEG
jgi:Flp pilus assembly pilin Flp